MYLAAPALSGEPLEKPPLLILIFWFIYFWPHLAACGILVPCPGIKPVPSALEVQTLKLLDHLILLLYA